MIPVRSRRFFGPVVLAPAVVTLLYTVPAGRTAIFHAITFVNSSALAPGVDLKVNGVLNANRVFLATMAAGTTVDVFDRIILDPGDLLYGISTVGTNVTVSGYGSLLDGAPS